MSDKDILCRKIAKTCCIRDGLLEELRSLVLRTSRSFESERLVLDKLGRVCDRLNFLEDQFLLG